MYRWRADAVRKILEGENTVQALRGYLTETTGKKQDELDLVVVKDVDQYVALLEEEPVKEEHVVIRPPCQPPSRTRRLACRAGAGWLTLDSLSIYVPGPIGAWLHTDQHIRLFIHVGHLVRHIPVGQLIHLM